METHPKPDEILRLLQSLAAPKDQRLMAHVLSCADCRRLGLADLGRSTAVADRPPERLAQVVPHPRSAGVAVDPVDAAIARAAGSLRLRQASQEMDEAPQLLARLTRHRPRRWKLVFGNQQRFRTLGLAQEILRRAFEDCYEDPRWAVEEAEAGLALLDLLDPAAYGGRLLDDCRARAWSYIGTGHRLCGEFVEAEAAFGRAGELLAGSSDQVELAGYLYLLALLRKDRRQFDRALPLFEGARRLYEEVGDDGKVARVLTALGNHHLERGDAEEALPVLLDALARVDEEHDPRGALFARGNVALCLAELGEFEEARRLFDQCRAGYARFDDRFTRLRAGWLEGKIAAGLTEDRAAEKLLGAARGGFAEAGLAYSSALVALDLAVLLARQGRGAELKALAAEMTAVFVSREVPAEVMAALALFRRAVEQERISDELVAGVARHLRRAQAGGESPFSGQR